MSALEAAARLAARLPSRTHRCTDDEEYQQGIITPVEMDGKRYPTFSAACQALGLTAHKLRRLIAYGIAKRL